MCIKSDVTFRFLCQILRKDETATQRVLELSSTLSQLSNSSPSSPTTITHQIKFIDDVLVFTLQALYKLLYPEDQGSYEQFRSMLYASNLNEELGKLGYTVSIYESSGKIDTTCYQLAPIMTSSE